MEAILNDYLEKIDKYLKPLPASERVDIVREIKSEMTQLALEGGLSPEQILERLGNPKELAGAYLGEALVKNNGFGLRRFATAVAFYSLTGLSVMFVLPFTGVLAVGLMLCGIIAPLAGIIQMAGYLLGFDTPFVVVQLGSYLAAPPIAFVYSIAMGILLFMLGRGCWQLTLKLWRSIRERRLRSTGRDKGVQ